MCWDISWAANQTSWNLFLRSFSLETNETFHTVCIVITISLTLSAWIVVIWSCSAWWSCWFYWGIWEILTRSTRCGNKNGEFITPNSFKMANWKFQFFVKISFWRFEGVRRNELTDFIAASCRSRSLVSDEHQKSGGFITPKKSYGQNELKNSLWKISIFWSKSSTMSSMKPTRLPKPSWRSTRFKRKCPGYLKVWRKNWNFWSKGRIS